MSILDRFSISALLSDRFQLFAWFHTSIICRLSGCIACSRVWIDERSKKLVFWWPKATISTIALFFIIVLVTQLIVYSLTKVLGTAGLLIWCIHCRISCVQYMRVVVLAARTFSLLMLLFRLQIMISLLFESARWATSAISLRKSRLDFAINSIIRRWCRQMRLIIHWLMLSLYKFIIWCLLLLLLMWNASFASTLQTLPWLWTCNRNHGAITIRLWMMSHGHAATWLQTHGWL